MTKDILTDQHGNSISADLIDLNCAILDDSISFDREKQIRNLDWYSYREESDKIQIFVSCSKLESIFNGIFDDDYSPGVNHELNKIPDHLKRYYPTDGFYHA